MASASTLCDSESMLLSSEEAADAIAKSELRIVLLGKTGVGKSATCCSILGDDTAFVVSEDAASCTQVCQHKEASRFGRNIRVVDTPGLMDTTFTKEQIDSEIMKCVTNAAPGVHAFLVVLRADARFTDEEKEALKRIQECFGKSMFTHMILVFTHKEHFDKSVRKGGKPFPERLDDWPTPFPELYNMCGKRAVTINNDEEITQRDRQAEEIVRAIQKMIDENNGMCYTDENLEQAEAALRVMAAVEIAKSKKLHVQFPLAFKAVDKSANSDNAGQAHRMEDEQAIVPSRKIQIQLPLVYRRPNIKQAMEIVAKHRENARRMVETGQSFFGFFSFFAPLC